MPSDSKTQLKNSDLYGRDGSRTVGLDPDAPAMSKTVGHTPTPPKLYADIRTGVAVISTKPTPNCLSEPCDGEVIRIGGTETREDFAYKLISNDQRALITGIVSAVNSHDALREALRTELEHLKVQHASARVDVRFGNKAAKPELHDLTARIAAAEKALALAEEQTKC